MSLSNHIFLCFAYVKRKGRMTMKVIRLLMIVLGALGVADTIVISRLSNLNLGVVLPAILGAPLLLIGLFLPKWLPHMRRGFGKVVKWGLIIGYGGAAVLFGITMFIIGNAASHAAEPGADALIVLGAGLRGDRPTLVLSKRLDAAYDYLTENPNTVAILSGGQGEGETVTEAYAMAQYLRRAGIAEDRLILEEQATSTEENFRFSDRIIKEKWGENARISFVTTDFHVYRAGLVAKAQGIDAKGIAAEDVWYIAPNNYLRESVAVWLYALVGRV